MARRMMNIGNTDGLSRNERLKVSNGYSNVLSENIKTTNKNIETIDNNVSIDIRSISATALLNTKVAEYTITIDLAKNVIISTTNTNSAQYSTQIIAQQNVIGVAQSTVITNNVVSDRTAILAEVLDAINALIADGLTPSADLQEQMYKDALGFPNAASKNAAEIAYYEYHSKINLGYPNAASAAAAVGLYIENRQNQGLGFPNHVNITNELWLPQANVIVVGNAIDSIAITRNGLGYTVAPYSLIIGGSGTGAQLTTVIKFRVTNLVIDNEGYGYNYTGYVRLKISGGGGSGATAYPTINGSGRIVAVTLLSHGENYSSAPTVEIITTRQNVAIGEFGHITAVIGNGYVSAVTVDAGGSGYITTPNIIFANNSFQALASGTINSGVITSLELLTVGYNYMNSPYVIFNGKNPAIGTPAEATTSTDNGIVTSLTLLNGGTDYNFTSAITTSQTVQVYNDYQLRLALDCPYTPSAPMAEICYFDNAMKTKLGYPNAATVEEAKTSFYDAYMKYLLTHPEALITPQSEQDQMYKDAFGYPDANTVDIARNKYRAATMASLLAGIIIEKPLSYPDRRTDMDIIAQQGVHKIPIVKREEKQVPAEEFTKRQKMMNLEEIGLYDKEKQQKITTTINDNINTNRSIVTKMIGDIYNSVSYAYRLTVGQPLFLIEKTAHEELAEWITTGIIAAAEVTYTAEAAIIQAASDIEGPAASAKIIADQTPIITYERDLLIVNVDNIVDATVADRSSYETTVIANKSFIITQNADKIASDVAEEIAQFGTYNPPSQAVKDQMYKDAYGYPSAGSVEIARQSYLDDNLKIALGFPDAVSVEAAKTAFIDLSIKTVLGFPNAVSVSAAAISAKDYRKRVILGYPDAVDASAALGAYLADGLRTALGFPLQVTKVTITNKGKYYKTPPGVYFEGGGEHITPATAYTILDINGEVNDVVIINGGKRYESAPTVIISGGEGSEATAVVSNTFSTSQSNAVSLYNDNYSKTALGYSEAATVVDAREDFINAGIKSELGFSEAITVAEAAVLHYNLRYQTLFGFPNTDPYHAITYITNSEKTQTIYGYPTDFLERYDPTDFPNFTANEAAGLLWFYDKMVHYMTHLPPGFTQAQIDQLYKDKFGVLAGTSILNGGMDYSSPPTVEFLGGGGSNAAAVCTINDEGVIITVTMTNHGTGYTQAPNAIFHRQPTDTTGVGGQITLTVTGGEVFIVITVEEAANAYYYAQLSILYSSQIVNHKVPELQVHYDTRMNINTQTITHEERVYGRKPSPTKTKKNALALKYGYATNLWNLAPNLDNQRSMSITSIRPLMTRKQRIARTTNYSWLYKQAEAYLEFKILQRSAQGLPPYTEEEKHAILYDQLHNIKGTPLSKQTPTLPPPAGEPFGIVEDPGKDPNLTHKERVAQSQTRAVIYKNIEIIIDQIEKENGGAAISVLSGDEVDDVIITDKGSGFKYPPLVRFVSVNGFGAAAVATLTASNELASIDVTHGGIGYTSPPAVVLKISAQERDELEDRYWYSIVKAQWAKEEAKDPQPP